MLRRTFIAAAGAVATLLALGGAAVAQEPFKIGLILPMTGPFASTGRQIEAAARLYMQQNGDTTGGKKIQLVLKDDTGVADITKRLAQELIVNEKVGAIAGFGLTPLALAPAPLATQAKVPAVVMAAATATITEASPFIVRTSFTLPQATEPMADWASQNGMKKVVTLVSDYGPGIDAEKAFTGRFTKAGGQVDNLRVPLANPDFSPFLQRVADAKPDALFVFVPSGVGAQFMKQFVERGLDKSGIKLIGPGDVTDDDLLNNMGEVALGVVTSHHYSAAHDSPERGRPDVDTISSDAVLLQAARRGRCVLLTMEQGGDSFCHWVGLLQGRAASIACKELSRECCTAGVLALTRLFNQQG